MNGPTQQFGPVGAVVFDGYWREHFTVLEHIPFKLTPDSYRVRVLWHGDARVVNPGPARETTHTTSLDPSRDRIVYVVKPDDLEAHINRIMSERGTPCS